MENEIFFGWEDLKQGKRKETANPLLMGANLRYECLDLKGDSSEVAGKGVGDVREHLGGEAAEAGKVFVVLPADMHEINALDFATVQEREHGFGSEMGEFANEELEGLFYKR